MIEVLHLPYVYYPDPVGGTEVYVQSLIKGMIAQGVKGSVAAPGQTESHYVHDEIPVFRFLKTTNTSLSHAYGEPDETAAQSFRSVLKRVRPKIVHLHAHTAAVSELVVDAAKDFGAKVVFTYHTPTVSCARGTMLLMGVSPCDGRLDVSRCSVCTLASHRVPVGARELVTALPHAFGDVLGTFGMSGRLVTALRIPALLARGHSRFRSVMNKADRVVAVCGWVRDVLLANDVPAEKIVLCRQGLAHGVSSDILPRANEAALEPHVPLTIGYFGRLDPTKGVDLLMEAMKRAPAANVRLRIFGVRQTGSERYTSQLDRAAALDNRITMETAVHSDAVTAAMQACDLVAVPSRWLETGPLVVYEAFAAGTPVLGSRLGGIAELVSDGLDGILIEPGDADAWSAAVCSLANDRRRIKRLREGIRPPRTMDAAAGEMTRVYRALLAMGAE